MLLSQDELKKTFQKYRPELPAGINYIRLSGIKTASSSAVQLAFDEVLYVLLPFGPCCIFHMESRATKFMKGEQL
jgi:hypothetical protein